MLFRTPLRRRIDNALGHVPWDERRRLIDAARGQAAGMPLINTVGILALVLNLMFALWLDALEFLGPSLRLGLFLFINAALIAVVLYLRRRNLIAALARSLRIRGIRPLFCLICHYNLRGSTAERCPECGEYIAPVKDNTPGRFDT